MQAATITGLLGNYTFEADNADHGAGVGANHRTDAGSPGNAVDPLAGNVLEAGGIDCEFSGRSRQESMKASSSTQETEHGSPNPIPKQETEE